MNKTAEVNISSVNPPRTGKKMGSIKTKDNVTYYVYADKLPQFSPGMHTIEFTDEPDATGKPFLKALGVVGNGAEKSPAPTFFQSAQKPELTRETYHDLTPKRIYVCGIVNNSIMAGQVKGHDEEGLVLVTEAAARAYDRTVATWK